MNERSGQPTKRPAKAKISSLHSRKSMTAREILEIASWVAGIAGTVFGIWVWAFQDNTPRTHTIENKPSDPDVQFIFGTWRDNKGGLGTIRADGKTFQYRYVPPSLESGPAKKPDGPFESVKISTVVQANSEWFIQRTHQDGKRIRYSKEDNERMRVDQTDFDKSIYYLL